MPAKKHTHKYYKTELGYAGRVWACALKETGCTHHLPKSMETDIIGRKSICWNCGDEFILGPLSLGEDKPRCNECRGETGYVDYVEDMPFVSASHKKTSGDKE